MAMHVAFPYIDILRYGGHLPGQEDGTAVFCCPDVDTINVFRIEWWNNRKTEGEKNMDIKEMLHQVRDGALSVEEAEKQLKNLPYEDLGYAKLDLHRKLRSGFPETVFCQGKPDEFLAEIFKKLYQENGEVFGTRASKEQYELVKKAIPQIE